MIEEMLDETFESLEDDDIEELADKEVEKILWEVTSGQIGQLSGTPSATPQDKGVNNISKNDNVTLCVCVSYRQWDLNQRLQIQMKKKI